MENDREKGFHPLDTCGMRILRAHLIAVAIIAYCRSRINKQPVIQIRYCVGDDKDPGLANIQHGIPIVPS